MSRATRIALASHLHKVLAMVSAVTFQYLRPHCYEAFTGLLQQTLADVIQGFEEFRDQPEWARRQGGPRFHPASQLLDWEQRDAPTGDEQCPGGDNAERARLQGDGTGFVAEVA